MRCGFVPDEWFLFFQSRTGITGFYTFCFTTTTYLFSKEIYVLEHNYYGGLSIAIVLYLAVRSIGPEVANSLDKIIDEYEAQWNQSRVELKGNLEEYILKEEEQQFKVDGQLTVVEAKREQVALQLEEEYRKRLMTVYETVIKHLNTILVYENRKNAYRQKNLREWVLKKVDEALTPDFLDKYLDDCIRILETTLK